MQSIISCTNDFTEGNAFVDEFFKSLSLTLNDRDSRKIVFNKIRVFLDSLRDELTIVMETDYVDKDYRDCYYNFYSKKQQDYSRHTIRFSFFEPSFNQDTGWTNNTIRLIKETYLGFLVIRPMVNACIGRNIISPKALKDTHEDAYLCLSTIRATCLGVKVEANGFPHSAQDGEMMTCAETTIWSILEYFGNKYVDYHPVLPSHIHKALEHFSYERQIPSNGLSFQQISVALKQQGFGTKIYASEHKMFKEIFSCYIESGIPLAVCMKNENIAHAIACVGRTRIDRNILDTEESGADNEYFIWNQHIDRFIFNDDNHSPYQKADFGSPSEYYEDAEWKKAQITHFIVPLHKRVHMDAEIAIKASNYLVENLLCAEKGSVVRTFLTSNRSFKEDFMQKPGLTFEQKQAFIHIDMPKFIWVTEVADKEAFKTGHINSFILLDATASVGNQNGLSGVLYWQNNGSAYFFDKTCGVFKEKALHLPLTIKGFIGNLR